MTEAVPTPKNSIDSRLRQRAEEHMLLGLLALRCHAEVLAYMEIISLEEFSQNRLAAALPGILECLKRNCPLAPSTCPDPCMRCVVCRLQVAGVPVKLLTVRLLTAGGSCKADSCARMGLGWCWCLLQELGGSALEHLPCCGHLVLPVAGPSVGISEGTVSEPLQKKHFLINGT